MYGPCLVVAGAGSGKTSTMTKRVAKLVTVDKIKTERILVLTFTNKAAKEMKERTETLLDGNLGNLEITTFHSFSHKELLKYGKYIGLKRYTICGESETKSIFKEIFKKNELDKEEMKRMKQSIDNLKTVGMTLEKYKNYSLRENDILFVYGEYEKMLKETNMLDFNDLIINFKKLLEHEELSNFYKDRFEFVMVDEFQDCNQLQIEILDILTERKRNYWVTGDDFQSIYSFRQSDVGFILDFEQKYSATVIKLEKNYRSNQAILNFCNEISSNINGIKKTLTSGKKETGGTKPCIINVYDINNEASKVCDFILTLLSKGVKKERICVLYRNKVHNIFLKNYLIKNKVKINIKNETGFFERIEIARIIDYLKFSCDNNNYISFKKIIQFPKIGIGEKTIEKILQNKNGIIEELKKIKKAEGFLKLLEEIKNAQTLAEKVELIKTSILKELEKKENVSERIENIKLFEEVAEMYDEKCKKENLEIDTLGFLNSLSLDEEEEGKNEGVNLMTIHSSKGLEFDVVIVLANGNNMFPNSRTDNIEEERRLFYVACSRAKKMLALSYYNEPFEYIKYDFIRELRRKDVVII